MLMHTLLNPRYAAPEVLQITGLKPETLQTWVNRGVIKLSTQNPGRGKRRYYSAIDVLKLAIMRRTDDLGIALFVALEWAEGITQLLLEEGSVDWNLYISHQPQKHSKTTVASVPEFPGLAKYSPKVLEPTETQLSEFVEPLLGTAGNRRDKRSIVELRDAEKALDKFESEQLRLAIDQSNKRDGSSHLSAEEREASSEKYRILREAIVRRPMNGKRREEMAQMGIHAEPVIIFPIGEISNGALAQLRGLDGETLDG